MDSLVWFVLGFLGGVIAGGVLVFLWQRRASTVQPHRQSLEGASENLLETILGGGSSAASPPLKTEAERVDELRQNLRLKFLYDEARVDEAVARERERAPDAGMLQWLEAAVFRWERENR